MKWDGTCSTGECCTSRLGKGSLSLRTDAHDFVSLAKECDLYSEDNSELLKDF